MDAPRAESPVSDSVDRAFYEQRADVICHLLPGMILTRRTGGGLRRARIVEVEAYMGPKDLASHSSKGCTPRTQVIFGPAGRAYVYFIYGMYFMLNIVVGKLGDAHAVLIRAAEPLDGWAVDLTGPGKLARAFGIDRSHNGMDLLGEEIFLVPDPSYRPKIRRFRRVGIDYAKHWTRRLLRYIDVSNPVAARLKY